LPAARKGEFDETNSLLAFLESSSRPAGRENVDSSNWIKIVAEFGIIVAFFLMNL
jgi:hypothetical protein